VVAVVEETEGATATGGVVDDFGHHGVVFTEIELVADANLAGWVDEDVPQAQLGIELAKEEDFDAGTGLFLVAIEASGEDLGVVEHKNVLFIEIIEYVGELLAVLNNAALGMDHHETTVVAIGGGILRYALFRKFVVEL